MSAYIGGVGVLDGGPGSVSSVFVDRIGVGVLTRLVPRHLVDEVVGSLGRSERRKRLLPARVVVYFVMGLALFHGDAYEEVMRKLVAGLRSLAVWREGWVVPTASSLCEARQRLGPDVLRVLFERVAVPCGSSTIAGSWLAGRRVMAVDGFDLDVPDSPENAEFFGYAGVKKKGRSAFPKVGVLALAECGTHAIVGAEVGAAGDSEHALARRLLASAAVEPGMLVLADRGLYSYENLRLIAEAGADALFRVTTNLDLPLLEWYPDGSYRSYIADPAAKSRNADRLKRGKVTITDLPGLPVRVVDYAVPGRGDKDETFTVVTTVTDFQDITAADLAAAYQERWEAEIVFDELKTHQRGPGALLRSRKPELVEQELWGFLLTHYGIRAFMAEAGEETGIDPDRLSFTRSLNVIRRQTTSQAAFSPSPPHDGHN